MTVGLPPVDGPAPGPEREAEDGMYWMITADGQGRASRQSAEYARHIRFGG